MRNLGRSKSCTRAKRKSKRDEKESMYPESRDPEHTSSQTESTSNMVEEKTLKYLERISKNVEKVEVLLDHLSQTERSTNIPEYIAKANMLIEKIDVVSSHYSEMRQGHYKAMKKWGSRILFVACMLSLLFSLGTLKMYNCKDDVVVIGPSGTGKSTLINMLINTEYSYQHSRSPAATCISSLQCTVSATKIGRFYDTPGLHGNDEGDVVITHKSSYKWWDESMKTSGIVLIVYYAGADLTPYVNWAAKQSADIIYACVANHPYGRNYSCSGRKRLEKNHYTIKLIWPDVDNALNKVIKDKTGFFSSSYATVQDLEDKITKAIQHERRDPGDIAGLKWKLNRESCGKYSQEDLINILRSLIDAIQMSWHYLL